MAWLNDWGLRERPLLGLLLALLVPLLVPTVALAQAPTDHGLKGEYYNGVDFDEFVLSRRDATIDFDRAHRPPAPGVTAEYFSVRWTGWCRPPADAT